MKKIVIGKINDISFRAAAAGLSNPAIIVIGEVVSLHPSQLSVAVQHKVSHHLNMTT